MRARQRAAHGPGRQRGRVVLERVPVRARAAAGAGRAQRQHFQRGEGGAQGARRGEGGVRADARPGEVEGAQVRR